MTLNQIRYFIEVCQTLNITKAAQKLHISQPSLTKAIKDLEKEFNINLFQRIRQRIYLTKEGEIFYQRLLNIMSEVDAFSNQMQDLSHNYNLVRIGIPPMMGFFLFPQIFAQFKQENPQIKVEIVEYGALEVQQILMNEGIDITMLIKESIIYDNIQFRPLLKSNFVLCVNSAHPLSQTSSITLQDVKTEPMILFNKGFYITNSIMQAFNKQALTPNIILETSQISTIKSFVQNNLAIAILLDKCIMPNENICTISITDFTPITIGIGFKQQRQLTSSTLVMLKTIEQLFNPANSKQS